jgi:ArsR family transcriptional regulator, lead/cadmium/zinc/bismuth-responsive transcriptional repressor
MNICSDIHMYQAHKNASGPSASDSSAVASVPKNGRVEILKEVSGEDSCTAVHLAPSEARRGRLMSPHAVAALAETFRVLGDPTRVRILDALSAGELCVCDIASLVGISESAVSHQLRLMRGMRLVRPRRSGRLVFYALDDHHIIELLKQALTHVEE